MQITYVFLEGVSLEGMRSTHSEEQTDDRGREDVFCFDNGILARDGARVLNEERTHE